MTSVVRLAPARATQDDVLRAYAVHRALILAEVDDRSLLDDPAHQAARAEAQERYQRLYREWVRA